jgi:hypothetical protein
MNAKQLIYLGFLVVLGCGCGGMRKALQVDMKPLALEESKAPGILKENHFTRDNAGSISEQNLRKVLAAPVFLEGSARLGVVPVATCYEPDPDVPLAVVPQELSKSMEDSGLFDVTTEVSTDWPADRGVSGLRELAARYRSEYLLLYRHRFVDRSYTNGWGWAYFTIVGALFVPSQTMETAGVLEATLFDVKTGTLLYTIFERVHDESDENIWHNDRKRREMKTRLLEEAAKKLADRVVQKARRLAAARPAILEKTVSYSEKPLPVIDPQ